MTNLDSPTAASEGGRPPMKSALLDQVRAELLGRFEVLSRAAMDAHAAATDPGSKAEGKYDTRSLEASYLAAGQARHVDDLAESVRIFDALTLPEFGMGDPIDAGALVEVAMRGEHLWFLLAPAAGGLEVSLDGHEITLLTPESPLYRKLVGMEVGDELDAPPMRVIGLA